MSEFGHFGKVIPGLGAIDSWGAGPFVIADETGKSWRFEDSDCFGPHLVKRNGDPLANPWPGKRCPFWRAHRIWARQGRRLESDGVTCIWNEPKPEIVTRLGCRSFYVIDHGEEDGKRLVMGEDILPSPSSGERT